MIVPRSIKFDSQELPVCALSTDTAGFTFPAHIHYEVRTRIVGNAVVDIYDQDYAPSFFDRLTFTF